MENDSDWQAQHLSVEQLFAYIENVLSSEESDHLQEHLASCRECCSLLLDMEFFCTESVSDLPDSVVTIDWKAIRVRIGGSFPLARSTPFTSRSWAQQLRVAWTAAAALALLCLGLGLRLGSLEKLVQPTTQIAILDLPAYATRGEGPAESTIPAKAERVVFLFHLEEVPHSSHYRLRLLDSRGAERFQLSGLRPDRDWTLTVEIPRSLLSSGRSRFLLSGVEREERNREYWVRLE